MHLRHNFQLGCNTRRETRLGEAGAIGHIFGTKAGSFWFSPAPNFYYIIFPFSDNGIITSGSAIRWIHRFMRVVLSGECL